MLSTIGGQITLGAMTMYLMLFRQGQSAVAPACLPISGMYEDNLYLSNLYEYLSQPVPPDPASGVGSGPGARLEFRNVSFRYPGQQRAGARSVNLQITPGQSLALVGENGSGKTTLIKLLTRLYSTNRG